MNSQDLSIFQLVLHASLVVQLVIVALLAMSLASWTVIFGKLFGLKRVRALSKQLSRRPADAHGHLRRGAFLRG